MILLSRLPDKCLQIVSILCKITLLPHFTAIIYNKVFELALTGGNTKNTKNTVIQKNDKKYCIFVKNVHVRKKLPMQYNFFKLHKILIYVPTVWHYPIRCAQWMPPNIQKITRF